MYGVLCTLYVVRYTVYGVRCTLYGIRYTITIKPHNYTTKTHCNHSLATPLIFNQTSTPLQ